jgi:DnaJ-domain-containing protein 1
MKSVFLIAIVAVAMIGIVTPSALAEPLDPGFIEWCCSVMEQGDRLTIDGRTYGNGNNQDSASFRITNPIGNLAVIDQVLINRDGFFTASFLLDGSGFKKTGIYAVLIKSQQLEWSFEFELIKKDYIVHDKTTATSPSPSSVNPLVIVGVLFALIAIALAILKISKRNSSKGEDKDEDDFEEPVVDENEDVIINVKEFLSTCELGDEDEFIRKFKSGKTEQECQRAYRILLSDLIQQNADAIVIWYVRTLIQGSKQEPTIPKRPDAPRFLNASTATQPLRVIVSWTAPNDGGSEITSYDLYRSGMEGQRFAAIQKNIQGLTFTDTLPSEGTWHYDVIANNSIGSSPPSPDASIKVGGPAGGNDDFSTLTGYTKEQREAYDTLGISPGSSDSEIKNAFRELYTKHDPSNASQHRTKLEQEKIEKIAKKLLKARAELMKK